MVDSAGSPSQALLVASHYVSGRNPQSDAKRLGHVLWLQVDLGPIEFHKIYAGAPGIRTDFQNLSSDVR